MSDLTVYEAGVRIGVKYSKFIESPDSKSIDAYLEIMKKTKPDNGKLVLLEKTYRLICTIPHIINS